jgi:hypothetical protein
MVGFAAFKWSRLPNGPGTGEVAPAGAADRALLARLDDELRDLD